MLIGGSLWVTGGTGANGLLGDTWEYTISSNGWRQETALGGFSPRYLHSVFAGGPQELCVVGGVTTLQTGLLVTVTAESDMWCLTESGWSTVSGPSMSVAGASVATGGANEVALIGGVDTSANVTTLVQRFNLVSRSWNSVAQMSQPARAYSAGDVNTPQQLLWRMGGLNPAGAMTATSVVAVGPSPSWIATLAGCEPGFTNPPLCNQPVCRRDCWGLGQCIAPDLCECAHGFTGPLCSQQLCTTCGVPLLPLNQPVYWPLARDKARRCIATLRKQIAAIKAQLPFYPATCSQTFPQEFPFNLTAVSKAAWDFRLGGAKSLALTTKSTVEDLI